MYHPRLGKFHCVNEWPIFLSCYIPANTRKKDKFMSVFDFHQIFSMSLIKYCGIIFLCGGPVFQTFVANTCPLIYIPMTVYTSICLIFIKIVLITLPTKWHHQEPGKFRLPTNFTPMNKKWFDSMLHVYSFHKQNGKDSDEQ